jgi:hypothetical protein
MRLFFFRMSILPAGLKGGGEVGDVDERNSAHYSAGRQDLPDGGTTMLCQ